jgi:hypothetical protein
MHVFLEREVPKHRNACVMKARRKLACTAVHDQSIVVAVDSGNAIKNSSS